MNLNHYSVELVATELLKALELGFQNRGKSVLAIPGGRSPGPVLKWLSEQMSNELKENTHLIWVDERSVPEGHQDRNSTATTKAWLEGGKLPANVHPMPAEKDNLKSASDEYSDLLESILGDSPIDAVLLGIGEDGHFASLFPNHESLETEKSVFYLEDSPKPPPKRMSLGLKIISKASFIAVLALGEAKGGIVQKIQEKGEDALIPASLLPSSSQWFLDDSAYQVLS